MKCFDLCNTGHSIIACTHFWNFALTIPKSFVNTPLNMPGCLVMQVRDSKVSFVPDKELGMLVHAHNPKTDKGTDDAKERVQSMQSYGMDDWESWKDYIEPHQCLMEHRTGDMYNSKLCVRDCQSCVSAAPVQHIVQYPAWMLPQLQTTELMCMTASMHSDVQHRSAS